MRDLGCACASAGRPWGVPSPSAVRPPARKLRRLTCPAAGSVSVQQKQPRNGRRVEAVMGFPGGPGCFLRAANLGPFGPAGQAPRRRIEERNNPSLPAAFFGKTEQDCAARKRGNVVSSNPSDSQSDDFRLSALAYHRSPKPGKIEIQATKPLATQHDLALAYTPGVAVACEAIAADPRQAAELTTRANLVGVVTNGTAVLGLGNIGPLAGKPVMEGKAVLFKKFAGIDVFDIEIDATDVDRLVEGVAAPEPPCGGN